MRWLLLIVSIVFLVAGANSQQPTITRIATNLNNPRGVAVLPDGRLVVVEAGDGLDYDDFRDITGRVSIFEDRNADGDYDDVDEITSIYRHLGSYNGLIVLGTGHDEVDGPGDIVALPDGRIFFTKGDLGASTEGIDPTLPDIGIMEIDLDGTFKRHLILRPATLNSITYDADRNLMFAAESGLNQLSAITMRGELTVVAEFPILASGQQAVPTGVAFDSQTGDVLVALFSGLVFDAQNRDGEVTSFIPGDSKIVRVNVETGEVTDEITGMTQAIDIAIDDDGTRYILEMTATDPPGRIERDFPLYDPDAPVVHGGYERFTGRVTMHAPDGETRVLAEGLDVPTNLTYHDGALYVSTGQGTPGRPIPGPDGESARIVGEIYRIDLAD